MKIFNFLKFKKACFNIKTAVVILAVLTIICFATTLYFAVKTANLKKEFSDIGPKEKLETIYSYALVLEKFEEFKRQGGQNNATNELEQAVLATKNGALKSLFDEIIFGGNLKKDMDYFMDAIVDSLKLFSQ